MREFLSLSTPISLQIDRAGLITIVPAQAHLNAVSVNMIPEDGVNIVSDSAIIGIRQMCQQQKHFVSYGNRDAVNPLTLGHFDHTEPRRLMAVLFAKKTPTRRSGQVGRSSGTETSGPHCGGVRRETSSASAGLGGIIWTPREAETTQEGPDESDAVEFQRVLKRAEPDVAGFRGAPTHIKRGA